MRQRFVHSRQKKRYGRAVRWEDLFADLEREWEGLAGAERQAEIAERTRAEFAQVTLADRLRGSEGRHVHLVTRLGEPVDGELTGVGADFVLLTSARHECVLPLAAVGSAGGLGHASLSEEAAGPVRARLGLGSVLRRIAADRSAVTLVGSDGRPRSGTLQRVGADFVELVEHAYDEAPRVPSSHRVLLVPFEAIVLLRREVAPG
jgi:hypothetical protein